MGLIPGQGTKMLNAVGCGKKKKDSTKKLESVKLKGLKSLHQNELLFYTPTLKHLKKEVSPIHNSIRAIKHMGTRK